MLREIHRPCPQNYIIKNPLKGSVLLGIILFVFLVIYQPLGAHPGLYFGYQATMAIYILFSVAALSGMIIFLKSLKYFSDSKKWTLSKELISIFLSLLSMGVAAYLAGFIMEDPSHRLNWRTFFDSVTSAFLIGIIPFLFFTSMNIRYWFYEEQTLNIEPAAQGSSNENENPVNITSQLKKEELSFLPSEFIYAESEGNYVNFYLRKNNQIQRKVIRSSISSVEQQLSGIPFIFRTHRAFIVNLKEVRSSKGNTLGYRLKLSGVDEEIPVSRNNTREFLSVMGNR